jgi:hypothetical protein
VKYAVQGPDALLQNDCKKELEKGIIAPLNRD